MYSLQLLEMKDDREKVTSCHAKGAGMSNHIYTQNPRATHIRAPVVSGPKASNNAAFIWNEVLCGFLLVPSSMC
jgi:hypothetical protein